MGSQGHSLSKTQPSHRLTLSSTEKSEQQIAVELAKIAVLMGEELSPERLALTVAELQDIPPHLLDKAFAIVRREGRYFPRPGDIRAIIDRDPMAKMKFTNMEPK